METYTYIKYDIKGNFVVYNEMFDETLYNNIGYTWRDYLDNKWVLLSEEQTAFHEEHPTATVKEVWDMELAPVHERTLDDAKYEMVNRIENYDNSSFVNSFTVNGSIEAWFTADERNTFMSSIESAEILGVGTVSFYMGEYYITLTIEQAKLMLAQIQLYADQCYNVTQSHIIEVNGMETIEEVDSFKYYEGYPEKLNFNFPLNEQQA